MVAQKSTPVIEYDMHEQRWIDHRPACPDADDTPHATPDATWTHAVTHAAQAMDAPPYTPRLQAAMDLVLAGAVVTSGTHRYEIDDERGCPCADAQHRSKWCKHATAVELYKRAMVRMQDETQPSGQHAPEQETQAMDTTPAPQPASRPTPPARCTIKWRHHGVEYLYTVEDDTDPQVLARIDAVLAERTPDAPRNDAPAPTPTPPQPAGPPPCPTHGSDKLKPSKFGGHYCAARHEADGAFCKYKTKD